MRCRRLHCAGSILSELVLDWQGQTWVEQVCLLCGRSPEDAASALASPAIDRDIMAALVNAPEPAEALA
jgi:hypothetical protein